MSQYGYGESPNPYAQQEAPAGQYGAPNYDNGYSNNVEMESLTRNGAGFANADPNAVLNECRDIGNGVDQIDANLHQLRMLQDRSLNETDASSSGTTRELDNLSADTMSMYRDLTERVRQLKSSPEAKSPKNAPQIGRIDRRLKEAIQQYQQVEAGFRKKMQAQMERQYRIVRPDAEESEVQAAVEDMSAGGQQVFQQAMMQSSRSGQARAVLNAVQDRHRELQKIEQQMIELAQLFQDMDTLIIQQEEAIIDIEKKGEEVVENLDKGNQEIGVAVETARKTRRKKWYCVGIVLLIILVIVIIVLIYCGVTGKFSHSSNNNNSKRSAVEYTQSKIVNVGQDYDETSAPLEKLSGKTTGKSIAGRIVVGDTAATKDRRSDVTLTAPSRTDYNDVD
ncbi:hypothetical protein VPNG_04355 [Cytospora leucostoma]|uniref:t-SNARE coiled-coil homology domain-containing protein n=1 Tax=Cytospora leucostoma TaxID=1230097 RepID=A0A423XC47_9PEZI|nr:hypothetical protein VPNG_04355 [Cytospora leucostoma]